MFPNSLGLSNEPNPNRYPYKWETPFPGFLKNNVYYISNIDQIFQPESSHFQQPRFDPKTISPNFGAMKLNYIGHELTYALFKFVWMFFYSFSLRRLLNFDGKIRKHFQQSFQCLCYQHTILSINGNQKIGNKCFQFLESLRNFRSSVQPQSKPVAHTTSQGYGELGLLQLPPSRC